jgi:hypothetical protein
METREQEGVGVGDEITEAQRQTLDRLAAGAVIRLPPWSKRVQLVETGAPGKHIADATFRVLLRYGWIERESGPASQVPTFRLSEAGRSVLAAATARRASRPARRRRVTAPRPVVRDIVRSGGQGATRPT